VAEPLSTWQSLRNSLLALPSATPLQAHYCWQPHLAQRIGQLVVQERFDVIHIEHLRGAKYGIYAQKVMREHDMHIPIVWDSVDCITHLFRQAAEESSSLRGRWLARLDLPRTQAYEAMLAAQFDQVTITSPVDRAALEEIARSAGELPAPIHVMPVGVDLDYFTPGSEPREAASIVFSGKMSYHANITAALYLVRQIMPLVWARRPEVKVYLVGKDPPAELCALAGECGHPQVVVTGTVPDLRPYLQTCTLAVAPMPYGAGIQNKVLEAMACATPVVANLRACSALLTQPDWELLVADSTQELAEAIIYLLNNPTRQSSLGQAARRYVERHHHWEGIGEQLEQIYVAATGAKNRALADNKRQPQMVSVN
jgi:polysaccharide biosynthesis protein PslH